MIIPVQYVEVIAGTDIKDAVRQMINYAKTYNCIVKTDFNGVELEVQSWSTIESILKIYEIETTDK